MPLLTFVAHAPHSAVRLTPATGTFQDRKLITGGRQQTAVNQATQADGTAKDKAKQAKDLKA